MRRYSVVVCGGTFDHFHKGHEEFLRLALSVGEKVLIGITSDSYTKTKGFIESIESFEKRKQSVISFLKKENVGNRVVLSEITSPFIPEVFEKLPIEAIVVSSDSLPGALAINKKRKEENMLPLEIITSPLIHAEDSGAISSHRIRQGAISRNGRVYVNPLWASGALLLPDDLRKELQRPFGFLIADFKSWVSSEHIQADNIITVGDVVTKSFLDQKIFPYLSVVDFIVERKKTYTSLSELGFLGDEEVITVNNPRSSLVPSLFVEISRVVSLFQKNKRFAIVINGEEDLAVLPVILCCPLGMEIFYGQPGSGVVRVVVTEEVKEYAYALVSKFTPTEENSH